MVPEEKKYFLEDQFILCVRKIDPSALPKWGKMNAQQMVEHVSGFFKVSTNRLKFPLVTPPELIPKYYAFLMSEKEFRENTKAPVLPEDPLPVRFGSMDDAIGDLERQVSYFFEFFSDEPGKKTLHPAFGELNFGEWVQLHHKHVKHHLKQFGIEI